MKNKSLTPTMAADILWKIKTEEDVMREELRVKCPCCSSNRIKLFDINGKYGVECRQCGAVSKTIYANSAKAYETFGLGEVLPGRM